MIYGIHHDYQKSRTYAFRGNNLNEVRLRGRSSINFALVTNKQMISASEKKQTDQPRGQKWPNKRNNTVSEVQSCVSLPWCIIPPHLCSYWWKNSGDQWSFSWNIKEIITIFFLLSFTTILVKGRSYGKMIARINGFPATLIDWISPKFDFKLGDVQVLVLVGGWLLKTEILPCQTKAPLPMELALFHAQLWVNVN